MSFSEHKELTLVVFVFITWWETMKYSSSYQLQNTNEISSVTISWSVPLFIHPILSPVFVAANVIWNKPGFSVLWTVMSPWGGQGRSGRGWWEEVMSEQLRSEEDAGPACQRWLSWNTWRLWQQFWDHPRLPGQLCKYSTQEQGCHGAALALCQSILASEDWGPCSLLSPPCNALATLHSEGEQSPRMGCLVSGWAAPMAPVLFPVPRDGQPEGRHSRSVLVASGKGSPTTARVCSGLAGSWQLCLAAYGVLGTSLGGWSCL